MKQAAGNNRKIYIAMIILPVAMIMLVLILGSRVWKEYRDSLMENQKAQLFLIAKTLDKNMEISLEGYLSSLDFLAELASGNDGHPLYETYLESQDQFVTDIFLAESGSPGEGMSEYGFSNGIFLTDAGGGRTIWQWEDETGKRYLTFQKTLDGGRQLCMLIDEMRYYHKMVSDIRVGTNGYVVIKTSDGRIIMHPQEEQWGIDVIAGRKALYPELDFDSLEQMVEAQKRGEEGILEYYSYWWTDPDRPRVKKLSAHAPMNVGDDFWIVSVVIDYDDFYAPIEAGFQKVLLLFAASLVFFLGLSVAIEKILLEQKKVTKEVDYLRELNGVLEEVHRSEETIAHQQRLQIMGTMTGGIAHEFNNFLTPIMGHAELLMMELPEDSEEYDSAKEIYEASEKAGDVVRQISALSRKNVETVYQAISAEKLIKRALKMISSVCPSQVTLESHVEVGNAEILGNSTQLNQVLLNICVNAVHAIGRQEGRIGICADCVDREILGKNPACRELGPWAAYIRIRIEDNGCGMDKETLRQIFNPFFTTKKSGQGTGLGLALAEQIVRSHKGWIWAESEKGVGSRFDLYLPVLERQPQEAVGDWNPKEQLRLVIAEDNAKIGKMLEHDFQALGVSVHVCRKSAEVLACLAKQEADVLVLGEQLTDGNGVELCMALKERYPGMVKLIMTDCVTREIVEAKQRSIIDGYLEKPVSHAMILEAVRNVQS